MYILPKFNKTLQNTNATELLFLEKCLLQYNTVWVIEQAIGLQTI